MGGTPRMFQAHDRGRAAVRLGDSRISLLTVAPARSMAATQSHEREVQMNIIGFFALAAIVTCVGAWVCIARRRAGREAFLRSYEIPAAVLAKFAREHAGLSEQQRQLVARGLQQFFLAYLKSGFAYVAMPSKVADDLWHEFILFTREYHDFCEQAFGRHLHHAPSGR